MRFNSILMQDWFVTHKLYGKSLDSPFTGYICLLKDYKSTCLIVIKCDSIDIKESLMYWVIIITPKLFWHNSLLKIAKIHMLGIICVETYQSIIDGIIGIRNGSKEDWIGKLLVGSIQYPLHKETNSTCVFCYLILEV